jgi:hypothetical protein
MYDSYKLVQHFKLFIACVCIGGGASMMSSHKIAKAFDIAAVLLENTPLIRFMLDAHHVHVRARKGFAAL